MKPTIESLENNVWPDPDFDSSLVRTGHALRKKPLDDLTLNDLRVAFNENVGADFLKDQVLAALFGKPAVEATYFEGDLLISVIRSPQFRSDIEFRKRVLELSERALPQITDDEIRNEIEELRKSEPAGSPKPLSAAG